VTLTAGAGILGWGQFGKSGKPPHVAQVSIFDAQGNLLAETQLKSGNMTPRRRLLAFREVAPHEIELRHRIANADR
jgi:hypothetical protein